MNDKKTNEIKKRVIKKGIIVFGVILIGIGIFIVANTFSMNHMITHEIEASRVDATNTASKTFSYQDLEGLPPPVQRYFRYVLNDGSLSMNQELREIKGK